MGCKIEAVFTYGTLARLPITGGAPRQMLDDVKYADWSPDGTELAIIRSVDGIDRLEYPIGKVLVQPSAGEGSGLGFVRISPDGQRVAFVHYRSPASLAGRVTVVDRTGKVTTLTDDYANIHGLVWKGDEIGTPPRMMPSCSARSSRSPSRAPNVRSARTDQRHALGRTAGRPGRVRAD